jgi:DNA-directed RNA polymerase subunit RPC12/RpoP
MKTSYKCKCGKEINNPYEVEENFEYVGCDERNNPYFKCKDCGVVVPG